MAEATSLNPRSAVSSRAGAGLTRGDLEIAALLSTCVRVITSEQLARTVWGHIRSGRTCAYRHLTNLVRAGVLCSAKLRAHPELPLPIPVWLWKPGDSEPPFGVVSHRLRIRWTEALRPVTVYTASERSARRFAGRGGTPSHPQQVTHDLHVTALYLRLLREHPADAERWVSEDALAPLRRGQKLPDAEIQDAHGRTIRVIEFGGSYAPERCRLVHEDCVRRQVPYELW